MFFLETLVCTSERTPHAPSLMLQVAGRGYAELLRKPRRRSSQNFPSPQLVAQSFKPTMDATPEEIAEILGKFERYLMEERRDLVARRETRPRPSILQSVTVAVLRRPRRVSSSLRREISCPLDPPKGSRETL
jgi:hypothetical protein